MKIVANPTKTLKSFVREIMPPCIMRLYRGRNECNENKNHKAYTWEGVYRSFREVPVVGSGFVEPGLVDETRASTEHILQSIPNYGGPTETLLAEFSVAPLVASVIASDRGEISILEIGGGAGMGYAAWRACTTEQRPVDYHVVELDQLCEAGDSLFSEDDRVTFHQRLPLLETIGPVDLIQLCSVLQYVEHYQELLSSLFAYKPRFIYLSKMPLGEFSTFVSSQKNMPGTTVPVWFINRQELVSIFDDNGYDLAFHGFHDRVYDTANLPADKRFTKYTHLLFAAQELND